MDRNLLPLLFFCSFLFGCQQQRSTKPLISQDLLNHADGVDGNWLLHGLNYGEQRFSPLKQINAMNVDQLGLVWKADLGSKRGIEATPLIANGVMYLTASWSRVFAIDVRSGAIIWSYDPEVPREYGERACCDVVNRGVAIYGDRIFVGTFDGRLIALDASTGSKIWEVVTVDQSQPYTITGAPRVLNGKVMIGNGGAEFGVRGYFTAYDVDTGEQLWRFYTVPGDPTQPFENESMELASETWKGEWWKFGGGGTVWDAMAYDPQLNLLYVGTGNGSPWNREKRSPGGGDNLFLASILAINPDSGTLVWHYQTTPGETWDFTATQHLLLADLEIDGLPRKVLMQAPKNGFFYVIDRESGALISANKFVHVNWADRVDLESGRPVETKWARYQEANVDIAPNYDGAHNWHPMAFNPNLNLVYIPARETFSNYGSDPTWAYNETGFGTGAGWNLAVGYDPARPRIEDREATKRGKLIALDPTTGEETWRVWQDNIWNGGLLATASNLLFQGSADGHLTAYNGRTGDLIWKAGLHTGILAPPVTYLVDGVQYLTVITGWGGGYGMKHKHTPSILPGTVYTFALNGEMPLPDAPRVDQPVLSEVSWPKDPEAVARGGVLFRKYCAVCHVVGREGGGIAPNLAYSAMPGTDAFKAVVLDGMLLPNGMPQYDQRLNENDLDDLQSFIFERIEIARGDVQ